MAMVIAGPAVGQEVTVHGITVRRLPDLPSGATHGYFVTSFQVVNGSAEPHQVTLELPATAAFAGSRNSLERVSRTVLVGPGSVARVALPLPPLPLAGTDVRIAVDGRGFDSASRLAWSSDHPQFWALQASPPVPHVLLAPRFQEGDFGVSGSGVSGTDLVTSRAEIPEATWSPSWLAYGGWDGIVVGAEELAAAPPEVRDALRRAVALGGCLLVLGAGPEQPLGGGGDPEELVGTLRVYVEGFGKVLATPLASGADLAAAERTRVQEVWTAGLAPWAALSDPAHFYGRFRFAGGLTVPVRGLFVAVIALTLLIGPIHVGALRHWRRPTWIFWTVPALSLLACLIVLGWAAIGEGLMRIRRTAAITLLDQRSHDASTLAFLGLYSTLRPGGLRFDAATEVTPMVQLGWGEGGQPRRVDWTEGQALTAGWIAPRLPAGFVLRKSESRRERLAVSRRADGPVEVTNGLGADLVALTVADAGGRLHTAAGPIAAGRSAVLTATDGRAEGRQEALAGILADLPSRLDTLRAAPASALWAGTYLAVFDAAPFVEPGLDLPGFESAGLEGNGPDAEGPNGEGTVLSLVLGILEEEL